ncbi:hypothetical protein [uncultured Nocardioides sp.]|uniref:hypothetical protein n=1 Tax=uncultured Nocardioides sp. TaxID=198441 RepID=UPI0025DB0C92|nr:hypothetical protein [uncultured Nocardioides sp.]
MTTTARRRMRSTGVSLGVTAIMAAGLSGCASSPDYAAVCVDPDTDERVDDDQCDDDRAAGSGVGGAFLWYYLGASSRVPALGSRVAGGTFNGSGLNGTVQRGGLPEAGGSSVRSTTRTGGFGGTSRGVSG